MSMQKHEVKTTRSRTIELLNNTKPRKSFHVLLAVTGSVATIKLIELVNLLKARFSKKPSNNDIPQPDLSSIDIKIQIVMTENSKHFMPKRKLINSLADPTIKVYDDSDEWDAWKKISDPVLHIELRKWADICVIAPLDANTMAKLSNGICDNLITCIVRAWDMSKPLIYCPAMNVHMYNHPITKEQLNRLQSLGYQRVNSIEKVLACGDFGIGAMATLESIVSKVIDNIPYSVPYSKPKRILDQYPTYQILPKIDKTQPLINLITFKPLSNGLSTQTEKQTTQVSKIPTPNITIKTATNTLKTYSNKRNSNSTNKSEMKNKVENSSNNNNNHCHSEKKTSRINKYTSKRSKIHCATKLGNVGSEDSSDDNEDFYDIDPSELLEQSMIVEDDTDSRSLP